MSARTFNENGVNPFQHQNLVLLRYLFCKPLILFIFSLRISCKTPDIKSSPILLPLFVPSLSVLYPEVVLINPDVTGMWYNPLLATSFLKLEAWTWTNYKRPHYLSPDRVIPFLWWRYLIFNGRSVDSIIHPLYFILTLTLIRRLPWTCPALWRVFILLALKVLASFWWVLKLCN